MKEDVGERTVELTQEEYALVAKVLHWARNIPGNNGLASGGYQETCVYCQSIWDQDDEITSHLDGETPSSSLVHSDNCKADQVLAKFPVEEARLMEDDSLHFKINGWEGF